MAQKARRCEGGIVTFFCPGCKGGHGVRVEGPHAWGWNGSLDAPTFNPSILIRSGHYAEGRANPDTCWCTYNAQHPDQPAPFVCSVCHSFVRDGRIQFLADSTHALAGQTVEIPDWE
ncbi:DUF6527 family protein [Occallatibacter riparius]|uniref:Ammonia monooxygenase n=1 Tax=Occallatibacter riparius TaxID=1002689 RepID=A0A9J7BUI3_9BACT|nr:DUF6527 family protein [Occallatibacter riparius]UWZ84661.1 hypothetical protein MOP44_01700 [Occallatibacter riparius]